MYNYGNTFGYGNACCGAPVTPYAGFGGYGVAGYGFGGGYAIILVLFILLIIILGCRNFECREFRERERC